MPVFHRKSQAAAAQIGRAEAVLARASSTEARLRDTGVEHSQDCADLEAHSSSRQPQTGGEDAEARMQEIEAACRVLESELERVEASGDAMTWLRLENAPFVWRISLRHLKIVILLIVFVHI